MSKKLLPPSQRKVVIKPNVKWIGKHPRNKNEIWIDKRLPKKDVPEVVFHEGDEALRMEKKHNKYLTAHRAANKDEKRKFGKKAYKRVQHDVLSLYDKKIHKKK
jgi:hypothetical protein